MKEIETLESRVVYQNKWMSVREDKIRRASGVEGIFGVVDKADFVVILPIFTLLNSIATLSKADFGSFHKVHGKRIQTQIMLRLRQES